MSEKRAGGADLVRTDVSSSMLALIARAASDPAVDVAKMGALLEMQRQLIADQAMAEFNAAFARLAPRLPRIKKDGEVRYPTDKNRPDGPTRRAFSYAPWESIDTVIRPLLLDEGFTLAFDSEPVSDGRIIVKGELLHVGGHSRKTQIGPLPLDTSGGKNNVQAVGSTMSYGKRYCGTNLLNLVFEGEDDDGIAGAKEPISAEQVKEISDLLRETGSDLDAFCRLMNVTALPDIERVVFPVAMNALMARKRQRARGAP